MADTATPSFLRRKVFGRIPVLYLVAAGVAVLAVVAWRMKSTADSAPTPSDTPPADAGTDTPDGVTDTGALVANPSPSLYQVPSGTPADTTPGLDTNEAWLKRAVEWNVSQGVSAGRAQEALQAYLGGEQLSYDQGLIRDNSVKQFGLPPESFRAGGTGTKPADPGRAQGPLPRNHKVVGPNDNTYAKLAQIYYGNGDREHVALIKAANVPQATWGNSDGPFPVDSLVAIPRYSTPKYFTSTKRDDTLSEIARKNGKSSDDIQALNPGMKFPVKPGTHVRVA